jgi:hypothetical protein
MAGRYGVEAPTAQNAVDRFVSELSNEGIIVPLETDGPNGHPPAAPEFATPPGAFGPPRLQKFTDMQELLLLDPIHEVDEAGWPHTRPPTAAGGA